MPRAFSEIAFGPSVRRVQDALGSRAQYAPLDVTDERGNALTEHEAAFIESRDTLFQATVGESGWPYVQHRGGPPGFIKVLDARTIAYPDFRGNRQYISVGNLQRNDRLAILMLDFAKQRRLKLWGRARLVDVEADPALSKRLALPDYTAHVERAFVVTIEAYDWNCPQHIAPRFTRDEAALLSAPWRVRAERAETELTALRGSATATVVDHVGAGPLRLVVTGIRQLTPRVRAYELRAADGATTPVVEPGAHLEVPVRLVDGREATRSYSIVRVLDRPAGYEIAVLRESHDGSASRAIHETFRLGTILFCGAPRNRFPLTLHSAPVVLVAGGIGITPLRSMARALSSAGRPYTLHYTVRSRIEAVYLEELEQEAGSRLTVYSADEGRRLDVQALAADAARSGASIYVCGPQRLIQAVVQVAARQGVEPAAVHCEAFSGSHISASSSPFDVVLARSGTRIHVDADSTVLEAVERAGISLPYSCRSGVCGACVVTVIDGTAEHRDAFLTDAERTERHRFCPCVSRATSDTLTLEA